MPANSDEMMQPVLDALAGRTDRQREIQERHEAALNNESDRGAVILSHAAMEASVRDAVAARLNPAHEARTVIDGKEWKVPIGIQVKAERPGFRDLLNWAHSLGLMGIQMAHDAVRLDKVRNICAHHATSFDLTSCDIVAQLRRTTIARITIEHFEERCRTDNREFNAWHVRKAYLNNALHITATMEVVAERVEVMGPASFAVAVVTGDGFDPRPSNPWRPATPMPHEWVVENQRRRSI